MPNTNRPSGLSPVKHLQSTAFNGQGNIYQIPAADVNAFAIGDPVISSGSGDTNGVPGVTISLATGPIRGVILGLGTSEGGTFNPNNLNLTYRPSGAQTTDWYAIVADDPNLIFEVQEHSNGTALAATEIGLNTVLFQQANNGFVSGWQVASFTDAAPAVTATLQVRLLGLSRRADNAYGAYAKWLVLINSHELRGGTIGVA